MSGYNSKSGRHRVTRTRRPKSLPHCDFTGGKVRYRDQRAAQDALKVASRGEPTSDLVPVRAYSCACGGWHLTSNTKDEGGQRGEQ